jgi:molybdopterin-guanine dinucleotide biosynthesis protein MobB
MEVGAPIEVETPQLPLVRAPKILSICGDSDSGKTLLVEALVRILRGQGLSVGTVKHATCRLELDQEGKDTWRHAQAGAQTVVLVGKDKSAVFHCDPLDSRQRWLEPFMGRMDWVIIEGFRSLPLPSVEVVVGANPDLQRLGQTPPQWRMTRREGVPSFDEGVLASLVRQLDTIERA